MRLGSIQKLVVAFLTRVGSNGAFIGSTTKAQEFRGLDLEQVERAITSLHRRGIIRKEGVRWILVEEGELDLRDMINRDYDGSCVI